MSSENKTVDRNQQQTWAYHPTEAVKGIIVTRLEAKRLRKKDQLWVSSPAHFPQDASTLPTDSTESLVKRLVQRDNTIAELTEQRDKQSEKIAELEEEIDDLQAANKELKEAAKKRQPSNSHIRG